MLLLLIQAHHKTCCDQLLLAAVAAMKSCSKAFFHGLRFSSPRLVPACHFSDGFEFSNFHFPQTLQNKRILSVHAVTSKNQDYLETEKPHAHQTEETKVVRIQFQLQKDYTLGEQIFLVRNDSIDVGAWDWDLSNELPMTWSEEHQWWFAEMDIPAMESIQYKYILKSSTSGEVIWQSGPGRLVMTWPTFKQITICEEWGKAKLHKERTKGGHFTYPFPGLDFDTPPETEETTDDTTDGSVGELSLKPSFESSPVDGVPSKPQDLETEEPQAQKTKKKKVVRIQFQLQKGYVLGEQLFLVRDHPAWGLENALPMTWSEEHQWWFAEVDVPAGLFYQYTFVSTSGDEIWQQELVRIVQTCETFNRITICDEWPGKELYMKYFSRIEADDKV